MTTSDHPSAIARLLCAALVACLFAAGLTACGDDDEPASSEETTESTEIDITVPEAPPEPDPLALAGIDEATGVYDGLEPDTRPGATTPPALGLPLARAAAAAGCEVRTGLRDEGNEHLAPGDPPPEYGTNPATSGNHDPAPTADGAYLNMPPEQHLVHSLEHGRVVVQYDPSLPKPLQLQLKGLFEEDPDGMILVPNPGMPYAVAATAWQQLLGCEQASGRAALKEAIASFRDEYRGKGPERIPL